MHVQQAEVGRLARRLQAQAEPQSETPSRLQGRPTLRQAPGSGIPYDTPPDELLPMRLACSPSPAVPALHNSADLTADAAPRWASSGSRNGLCSSRGTCASPSLGYSPWHLRSHTHMQSPDDTCRQLA